MKLSRLTFVDDTFEPNDREQSTGNRRSSDGSENNDSQQCPRTPAAVALKEEIRPFRGHSGQIAVAMVQRLMSVSCCRVRPGS
jgi:hypothetical protein